MILALLDESELHSDDETSAEVRGRVLRRLDHGWMGSGFSINLRRKYQNPIATTGPVAVMRVDPIERLIMQSLSITSPARQYGVSSRSLVFTASTNGWSDESQRVWLSGLSPVIDDVGQYYAAWRRAHDGKIGGRFFERDSVVFNAANGQALLRFEDI